MRSLPPQVVLLTALSLALGCGGVTSAVSPDAAGADTQPGEAAADAPSPDTSEASSTEGRIVEACAAVAKAACDKRVECSGKIDPTGVGIIRMFGTMAECLTRQALQCVNAYRAPGSGHSLATEEECASAFATYSCEDFFADNTPPPCQPPGARVNGAACAFDSQCLNDFCTGEKNALCGTCGTAPAVGASCGASDCARGQVCDSVTTTCKTLGAAGDPCDSNDVCGYALVCSGSAGTTANRVCQTTLDDVGAACGGVNPVCDGVQGLFCGGATAAHKCASMIYVAGGKPCGLVAADSFATCLAGGCYTDHGVIGSGETGTCKTNAKDGDACDTMLGPACELPARCILSGKGTAGTCRVPTGTCG